MPEAGAGPDAGPVTRQGAGRLLVFVYGVLAFAATGRASYELVAKLDEAPIAYSLSAVAAVVYLVATWALATGRRTLALATIVFELLGVLGVGVASLAGSLEEASVWSDFGAGYGWVPLVLPVVGLVWLLRRRPNGGPNDVTDGGATAS